MNLAIGKSMRWWEKGLQPNMREIESAQDLVDSLASAGDRLVIVDFFSPGCGGCRALHPKVWTKRMLDSRFSVLLWWSRNCREAYAVLTSEKPISLCRFASLRSRTRMSCSCKWTMRSTNPCATASMSMSSHSSGFTGELRGGSAASVVPMQL